MASTENQRSAVKIVTAVAVAAIVWTSVFSVSAQAISDENSTNTETQVSDELLVLPNGDAIVSNEFGDIDIVDGVTVDIKVGANDYKSYDVPKTNVGDALEHANIKLGEYDTVNKSLKAKVDENTKIKVNRVSFKKTTKTKKLMYKTVKKKTSSLYVGQKKVIKKGKKGTKKVTYTKKIVNGKVTKTIVSGTKITKKSSKKVVLVGTKRKNYRMYANNPTSFKTKSSGGIGTIYDHNGKKIAYKKVISGPATAYSASAGARTSVGDSVHIGGVAVNPNVIPYGSKLYIETPDGSIVYGYAVANDTGGFIHTSNTVVDLFFPSESTCIQFGRRNVKIYVLA
ncbi:MAG: G5 domain-containing protein [Ruminococcus sp.]|nr:G5 domain-containing protein [Ruminococcus sp.]